MFKFFPMKSKPRKDKPTAPTDWGNVSDWYDEHVGDAPGDRAGNPVGHAVSLPRLRTGVDIEGPNSVAA